VENQNDDDDFDDDLIYLKMLEAHKAGLLWEAVDILMSAINIKDDDIAE
jgi:hypothetical protein